MIIKPYLQKYIPLLGNITFAGGALLAVYVMIKTQLLNASLPEGACPLTTYNNLIYTALTLLAISLVLSFLERKKPGKPVEEHADEQKENHHD